MNYKQYIYTLIIPHYNIPELLKRLLDTVPIRDDLQVIIVDDCSTKNITKLTDLKAQYYWVEWYTTGTNGGGGKARNIGLEHAKGQYLMFADADDFFTPGISDILDKYKHTNYDMVIYSAISLHSETYQINSRANQLDNLLNIHKKNEEKGSGLLKYVFGEPWCRLIRAELIYNNHIRFQEVKCHNDTKFTYMVGHQTVSLKTEPIVGYVITFRNDSVINTNYFDRYEIEVEVFSEKQLFFINNKLPYHVSELFYPIVHDLLRGKINEFKRKYNTIHDKYPDIQLKSGIITQIYNSIIEKVPFIKKYSIPHT